MTGRKLKVIFVAYHHPRFMSITEYCERALKSLGHEYISFNDRDFIIPGRFRQKIQFLHNLDLSWLNERLLKKVQQEKPDLCIVAGGHNILPETIDKMRALKIKTCLWTTDAPSFDDWQRNFYILINTAKHYDHVFCGGSEAIDLLSDLGLNSLNWLPFACDGQMHKPVEISKQDQKMYGNDIVFVGSFYPNRAKVFEQIADFDLAIWGPGWEKLDFYSPIKKCIKYAGDVKPELWLKIYAASKMVIVVHYQDGKNPCYQVSPKVYEALACRCPVLVDSQMDLYANFEHNKHLSIFNDAGQLRENISFLLDNPDKALAMAIAGYQEAVEKHTYRNRMEQLIDIAFKGE